MRLKLGRGAVLARRLTQLVRDAQDRTLGTRPLDWNTWLDRSLRAQKVDLVWFSTPYAEDCDLPYVFTIWDLEYLDQPWFPEVSRRGEWERRHHLYTRHVLKATRIIVPNEAGREQVLRYFPVRPNRILTLPHPTPAFALEGAGERDFDAVLKRLGVDPPYLFYPAQYWPHKNHAAVLAALDELNARPETFKLVCAGSDKGALTHVRTLARKLGVEAQVRFLGFVETSELVALYRGAYALVYLSYFGPENLPPLEALALGCPVVCADVPGAREQLGSASLFVSPSHPPALAEALRSLGDDSLRGRLMEAGRSLAKQRSASAYVRGVIDFLDDFEPITRCWR